MSVLGFREFPIFRPELPSHKGQYAGAPLPRGVAVKFEPLPSRAVQGGVPRSFDPPFSLENGVGSPRITCSGKYRQ